MRWLRIAVTEAIRAIVVIRAIAVIPAPDTEAIAAIPVRATAATAVTAIMRMQRRGLRQRPPQVRFLQA